MDQVEDLPKKYNLEYQIKMPWCQNDEKNVLNEIPLTFASFFGIPHFEPILIYFLKAKKQYSIQVLQLTFHWVLELVITSTRACSLPSYATENLFINFVSLLWRCSIVIQCSLITYSAIRYNFQYEFIILWLISQRLMIW